MYVIRKELDPAWVDVLQAIIAGVVGVGGVNALKDWAVARENGKGQVQAQQQEIAPEPLENEVKNRV
jgi:hypothetical protein